MKKTTSIILVLLSAVVTHKSVAQTVGMPYIPWLQETVANPETKGDYYQASPDMNPVAAHKSININKTNDATQLLRSNLAKRIFEANTELQNFSQNNTGDTLVLDFFADRQYKAVVKQVSKSYDEITGITAQILNTQFGYCFISASENSISISAEVPQTDDYFSTKKENGLTYLLKQKLSEVRIEAGGECNHVPEKNFRSSPVLKAVAPTLPDDLSPATIDVLVLYTPVAEQYAIQASSDINTMIDFTMQRSNLVLNNSQTNVRLNIVHKQQIDYTESTDPNTDLGRLRNSQDGFADEAHAIRSRYNADLVMLILGEVYSSNVLGASYVLYNESGNAKSGFSVVRVKTLGYDYTMIHELGHNFGCGHHIDTDNNAIYAYAHGYKGTTSLGNKFSTIMSYENTGGIYHPRIPYFSNPDILYENTQIGDPDANNAKTIRQLKSFIASYDSEVVWTDAFLQNIDISAGTLTPAFNPGVYNYTVNVDNSITNIDVAGIANSQYATVKGNMNGIPLSVGDNLVEIEVEDGWQNYLKKYTLKITRSTGFDKPAIQAQAGIGTLFPQATFEVAGMPTETNVADGVIMPRLTGDELKAKDNAYGTAQTGAMIYVTSAVSSASTKTAKVTTAGYYYFDGAIWQAVKDGKTPAPSPSPAKPNNSRILNDANAFFGAFANTPAYNAGNSTLIDFTQNNLAYTTANAENQFTLKGLKKGGTYAFAVQGAVSGTASFTATGFTVKIVNNQPSVANKHTLYNMVVMDSTVYVYVTTGF